MGTREVFIDLKKQIEVSYSGKKDIDDPETEKGTKKMLAPYINPKIAVQMLEENLRKQMEEGKQMALADLQEFLGEYFWVRLLKEIEVDRIPIVYTVGLCIEE